MLTCKYLIQPSCTFPFCVYLTFRALVPIGRDCFGVFVRYYLSSMQAMELGCSWILAGNWTVVSSRLCGARCKMDYYRQGIMDCETR